MKLTNCKRGGYLGNRGFAVSGILYPILILTLFLIVQILTMMASRKAVLDKNKQQLLDSVNASNKIYTNEELSTLIAEQRELLTSQTEKINQLETTIENNKKASDNTIDSLKKHLATKNQKSFTVSKMVTGNNYKNINLVVNMAKGSAPMALRLRLYGQYQYINYGGYIEYDMAAFISGGNCHGFGETLVKKGSLGNFVSTVSTSCSQNSNGEQMITMSLQFNTAASGDNGSNIYGVVVLYDGYGVEEAATVSFN